MEKNLVLVLGIIAIIFISAALGIGLMLIKKHQESKARHTKKPQPPTTLE